MKVKLIILQIIVGVILNLHFLIQAGMCENVEVLFNAFIK